MSFLTLLILAVAVSADAFAVALGKGLQVRGRVLRNALVLGAAFGIAQAVMPLVGWLLGTAFAKYVEPVDHWIAFILLVLVGGKMLWEALTPDHEEAEPEENVGSTEVAILAVATSIDALAVGISLAMVHTPIVLPVIFIGLVTFGLSVLATYIGHKVGTRYEKPAEIVGGVVLILIGVQILLEHLGVIDLPL